MKYCWICKREFNTNQGRFPVGFPTAHHIIPQEYRKRRKYTDQKEETCKVCHLQVNKMFKNKELLNMTKKDLLEHPKILSWIRWIRKE